MSLPTKYDAVIIGTGQAGPSLAYCLSAVGMSVAIVERKLFGGTCVNTGCIPTKTMVELFLRLRTKSQASDFPTTLARSFFVRIVR